MRNTVYFVNVKIIPFQMKDDVIVSMEIELGIRIHHKIPSPSQNLTSLSLSSLLAQYTKISHNFPRYTRENESNQITNECVFHSSFKHVTECFY